MKVINISELDFDSIYEGENPYSANGFEKFKHFLEENNYDYYGVDNENFDIKEAIEKAKKLGADAVVVENLS